MPLPDEQIHPNATGNAAKTVEKHQDPTDLVFYAGWFCPYVQRSWIVLEEKSIPYQYKEVNPYKKEKHFLDINPKGLVPALEYKGQPLYESLIISEFLEEEFPDHKPNLLPPSAFERAHVRLWIDHIGKKILPPYYRTMQAQEEDVRKEGLEDLYKSLKELSDQVQGPYFLGEQFSLLDAAIAPFAARDYILADHRGYDRAHASENWKQYAGKLVERESVKQTTSELQHYEQIYQRYLKNEAQSEVAKATRGGKNLP